jgi:glycerol-3-phosphate dehydrogenase
MANARSPGFAYSTLLPENQRKMDRTEILDRVREQNQPWDIVVIGGGATGVGCALDAASRGLEVLLLEQHDFGKGTSSRSTKLIHGGVRYLAQGNVSLVREALRERHILFQNAPHLVHELEFIVPCYGLWEKFYYGTGLKIYDLLAGSYGLGRSKLLSRNETLERLPNINEHRLSGGILYFDGQFDDTRLLIDLVRTAYDHGGVLLNYAKVSGIEKDENGRAVGVHCEDTLYGEQFTARAKAIVNATGVFCDSVRRLTDPDAEDILTLSQGVHLVFGPEFLRSDSAMLIPKTSDGRVLFCIPWHGHTLVGTTDTLIASATLEPAALEAEIDFIVETAAGHLAQPPTRDDILSTFTGIRPLVKSSASRSTSSLSRGHTIEIDASGMLTITGGKWTTYRRMAEDAIDRAVELTALPAKPSATAKIKIASAEGTLAGEKLHTDLPYCTSDVIRAVRGEMAHTLEDVLARRTRALFLNAKAAIEIAPRVAAIMAVEMGRDDEWQANEIKAFLLTARKYMPPTGRQASPLSSR